MKNFILAGIFLLSSAFDAQTQGMISFSTRVTGYVIGHVYGVGDGVAKAGNTATEWPAGTQTYAGSLLTGNGFSAQLFGGPLGTVESELIAIGVPSTFRTQSALVGTPQPQLLSVPGVPAKADGTFQVRAWDNAGGTISSWELALIRGQSDLFTVYALGDGVFDFPAVMENFRSFNINPIGTLGETPEPHFAALLGLGALGCWVFRGRK